MRWTRPVLVLLAVTAGSASAGSGARSTPRRTPAVACPEAGRAQVVLAPGLDGIDGVRVFVADAAAGAATDVTVLADGRDRTVRALAPGITGLTLDEPMLGRTVEVALEPVLEAPRGACVSRVELLRAGVVVGSAEIR